MKFIIDYDNVCNNNCNIIIMPVTIMIITVNPSLDDIKWSIASAMQVLGIVTSSLWLHERGIEWLDEGIIEPHCGIKHPSQFAIISYTPRLTCNSGVKLSKARSRPIITNYFWYVLKDKRVERWPHSYLT